MDRDALVEAMARALCLEKYQHPVDRDLWDRMQEGVRDRWLALARAALAVAEPVIQAAERERCAAVLDDWQGVPALNDYRASRKAYAVAIRALPPTR